MRTLLSILAVLVTIGAGAYYLRSQEFPATSKLEGSRGTSVMRAEENMVVVVEQKPGTSIMGSRIVLAKPGYLVIHEGITSEPGAIIGSSSLLSAGESESVEVRLSRATRDGETLYVMLHFERGGNAQFNESEDTPVPSAFGGSIHSFISISSDAPDETPVVI